MTDDRPPRDRAAADRLVVRVSIAVIAAAVLAIAFFVGTRSATPRSPAAAVSSTALRAAGPPATTPTGTVAPTSTAPLAAGDHLWSDLRGGECLGAYTSAWQVDYDVVDCSLAHPAQLLRRVPLTEGGYPGATALASTLSLTCESSSTVDRAKAAQYSGLRIAFSYPTEAQWTSGIRFGSCFVSRTEARTITGSLAAG